MPKIKQCKMCTAEFTPSNGQLGRQVCSIECALAQSREKQRINAEKAAKKRHIERKQDLRPRSYWLKRTQTAFNAYIRQRDWDKPCISCGKTESSDHLTGGYWHAGHYRTTAAQPALRFNELNCHKQCPSCNNHKSGNITEYRIELSRRIGPQLLEWLEKDHTLPSKWTIDELKALRTYYVAAVKAIQ